MLYNNLLSDLRKLLPKLKQQLNKTNADINKFFSSKPKSKSTIIENTEFFTAEIKKLTISLNDLKRAIDDILKQIQSTNEKNNK